MIGVAGDYLGFGVFALDADRDDWGLVERIATNTYLAFYGLAGASMGSTVSTPFEGWVYHCVLNSTTGSFSDCHSPSAVTRECESKNHRLIWTRQ